MWLLRFKTFLKSLFWHINNGLPKSSLTVIQNRFAICINCDSYSHEHGQCMQCGCNINNKKTFLNKLAWADQECPLKKWHKEL